MFSDAIEVAIALVGLGLVVLAVRQARTKGWAASLQMAAAGFLLMGGVAIGVVGFIVGLVFSPLAWLGVGSLAVAAALFAAGQRLEGRANSAETKGVGRGDRTKPIGESPKRSRGRAAEVDPELADIEAILRRHGIE